MRRRGRPRLPRAQRRSGPGCRCLRIPKPAFWETDTGVRRPSHRPKRIVPDDVFVGTGADSATTGCGISTANSTELPSFAFHHARVKRHGAGFSLLLSPLLSQYLRLGRFPLLLELKPLVRLKILVHHGTDVQGSFFDHRGVHRCHSKRHESTPAFWSFRRPRSLPAPTTIPT